MASYQYCTVADEGRIRTVTLNRPDVMNALHSDAHDELETVWDEFAASDDLWLAIITGAGGIQPVSKPWNLPLPFSKAATSISMPK